MPNQEEILLLLKRGDNAFYKTLYETHREEFLGFASKQGLDSDDAIEVFQQSLIILFENATSGKLSTLTSSLKTYIFGIGRLKMLESFRKNGQYVNLHPLTDINEEISIEEVDLSKKQLALKKALLLLGEKCKQLIELYYLNGLTIKEIVTSEGYANANTVKAQKSRCMKQLKSLMTTDD